MGLSEVKYIIHNTSWWGFFDEIIDCLSKDNNIDLIYLGY